MDEPTRLVKLRSEFKNLGMRAQESQLTYVIRRTELSRQIRGQDQYVHSWAERTFNTVFFDWTCQYGMSPGRPLLVVAALSVMLSIVYIFAQVNPGPNGGIWAVWNEHRIKQAEGSKEPQQLTDGFPSDRSEISFLLLALYFSFLSATRIGWRELNVGTWITRIQPREYSLRAYWVGARGFGRTIPDQRLLGRFGGPDVLRQSLRILTDSIPCLAQHWCHYKFGRMNEGWRMEQLKRGKVLPFPVTRTATR